MSETDVDAGAGRATDDLFAGRTGRLLAGGALAYVALVVASVLTTDPTVDLVADAFFGLLAVAFGVTVTVREGTPLASAAGASLAAAGVATLGGLLTGVPTFDALSNAFLIGGIVLYVVHRRRG